MQQQYTLPIASSDGKKLCLQIKHKNVNAKKRKVKTWTTEQDTQLVQLYEQYPKKWASIASLMQDRNQNQCLHRYRRLSQLGLHRKIWTAEQDQTVKRMIKKVGKNWKILSQMLGSKTGKQIRERYINKLDPKIKKEDWTDEEDRKIIELYTQLGSRWSEISKKIPGRPENKIKNRFYSYIQKNYDIKCQVLDEDSQYQNIKQSIEQNVKQEYPQSKLVNEKSGIPLENQKPFKDISNQAHISWSKVTLKQIAFKQSKIEEQDNFPSIREIELQAKQEDDYRQGQKYEDPQISHSKLYIRSLVNVDQDWMQMKFNKSFENFNDPANQLLVHDFFYLSHQ